MRGTSCSSWTLLNVTYTTPVREAQHHHHQRNAITRWWSRQSDSVRGAAAKAIPARYHRHILLFLLLLVLNFGFGNARKVGAQKTVVDSRYPENGNYLGYPAGSDNNDDYSGGGVGDPVNQKASPQLYIKDTQVKTIRFANTDKKSTKKPRHHHHHHHHKKTHSTKKLPSSDSDGGGGDAMEMNLNGDYGRRGNDEGDYNDDGGGGSGSNAIMALENNDVQKIGWSAQNLKSRTQDVAERILAEADKMYNSLTKGSKSARRRGGETLESTLAILLSAKPSKENLVICEFGKKKLANDDDITC